MKLSREEQWLKEKIESLAKQAAKLQDEPRIQVTRRLLEAAAWRITYAGEATP